MKSIKLEWLKTLTILDADRTEKHSCTKMLVHVVIPDTVLPDE